MVDQRSQVGRLLAAGIWGEARHRARWRELSGDEEGAAVSALAELAARRADLLAEVAGVLDGASEGQLDEATGPPGRAAVPPGQGPTRSRSAWIGEGRRRRAIASMPLPPSGGMAGARRP
jgi:hypothetical protein